MKITIVGMGYVGLANAITLSEFNTVTVLETSQTKIDLLNKNQAPIEDSLAQKYLDKKSLKLNATCDPLLAYSEAEYILIATPTNYDENKSAFDTSSVEQVIEEINDMDFYGLIVIKSTVPVGFTEKMINRYPQLKIAFFPEFLREGCALFDCLNPSRIICGSNSKSAKSFLKILLESCDQKDTHILVTTPSEAEAIKLFANTYLAMRIAFFNELDSYALENSLDTKNIIKGISFDPRIGDYYNNPSFGYGGYCLPKDTKQLAANFNLVPQDLISSTIKSNQKRKRFIANYIKNNNAKNIGIFKLTMKTGSDNWRESAIIDIINYLKNTSKNILIYEPLLHSNLFMDIKVTDNFEEFIQFSQLIVANRIEKKLSPYRDKVFTSDIFFTN